MLILYSLNDCRGRSFKAFLVFTIWATYKLWNRPWSVIFSDAHSILVFNIYIYNRLLTLYGILSICPFAILIFRTSRCILYIEIAILLEEKMVVWRGLNDFPFFYKIYYVILTSTPNLTIKKKCHKSSCKTFHSLSRDKQDYNAQILSWWVRAKRSTGWPDVAELIVIQPFTGNRNWNKRLFQFITL